MAGIFLGFEACGKVKKIDKMRERMSGNTNTKEIEFVLTHNVGEVPSSIGGGKPVEIEDPYGLYIKRLAKNHVDIPTTEIPQSPDELIETALKANLVNSNIKPDSVQNICTIAEAKIEAVEQNFSLPKEVKKFADNFKENIQPLPIFTKEKDGLYIGPASEAPGLQQVDLIDSPSMEKPVIVAAKIGLVLEMSAKIAGCTPIESTSIPEIDIPPQSPASEVFVMERPVSSVPAGSIETVAPTEIVDSSVITAEDVKNIEAPSKLVIDATGKLRGLPEDSSQETIDNVKFYYELAKNKFSDCTIYYSKDPKGESFVLFAVTPKGKLKMSVVSYGGGPMQYNDYPIDFYNEETGKYEITGDYEDVSISNKTWGCVWKDNLPRVVAHKITVGKDSYYKYHFQYPTYVDDNPWVVITGLEDKIEEFESTDVLNVDNYRIVDGNIQEKEADDWKEVSVPYEAGYISYVELHEGKMYGIDTADRAVVVRNEETGEWEKFDRPVGIVSNYLLENEYKISTLPQELLEEVEVSDITRLNDNGNILPWGIVKEEYPYEGYSYKKVYYSGYFLGGFTINNNGHLAIFPLFEIPYKYGRQIVVYYDLGMYYETSLNTPYAFPNNGNIQESQLHLLTIGEFSKIIENPKTRGKQVITVGYINSCDYPSASEGCKEYYTPDKNKYTEAIKNNDIISLTTRPSLVEYYISESLLNN